MKVSCVNLALRTRLRALDTVVHHFFSLKIIFCYSIVTSHKTLFYVTTFHNVRLP
jgi:hypothetical protein